MKQKSKIQQEQPMKNRWWALLALCAAQFVVIMDTSIIGVALPAIQQDLGYESSALQWIFNAYVIVFGGFLLLGGKLSDVYGPKNVFLTGFVVLTLASIYTGFAWSPVTMNIGRALQGLGAALIAPSALTLLMTIFTDPQELGKAFGFWGASAAAGGSAGVFLGGVLTEYLSWRWTFFINVPIGLFVLILGGAVLIKGRNIRSSIDYIGALLITLALTFFVYALVTVESYGLVSGHTMGYLAIAVVLLGLFIYLQKNSVHPLIHFSIFQVKNLVTGNLVMSFLAAAWIPLWFFLNLYLQKILGFSAFYSGLALLPMTIIIMIFMMMITGKLIQKYGPKSVLLAGLLVLTLSLVWFSFVPVDGSFVSNVLGASMIGAIGMSLAYIPATMLSISGARPEEAGLASGIVNTTYQVGSAIGLAVVVAFSSMATENVTKITGESLATINHGFQVAFVVAAVIAALGFLFALRAKK